MNIINLFTLIVSLISPGSHVLSEAITTRISRLACDGRFFKDFKASSKEFCKDGSPVREDE